MVKITRTTQFQGYLPFTKTRVSGNIIEEKSYLNLNDKMPIKMIDKDHYVNLKTGEILDCIRAKNRSENKGLKESKDNMMSIVNENFTGGSDQALVTTTYRENMQDAKKLCNDIRYFVAKIERICNCTLSYLVVMEPQERGAWHAHILFKRKDGSRFYLNQKTMMDAWGHGGVNVKRLKSVDNVGAYLAGYLNKAIRSHWYPPGFNFYRCTHDLRRPAWESKSITDYTKNGGDFPVFEKTYLIEDDSGVLQVIRYRQYNTIRKSKSKQGVS